MSDPSPSPAGTLVTSLNINDVLCGRGTKSNDNIGNIRFRQIIALHRNDYIGTSGRAMKSRIANKVLHKIQIELEPRGRFLKRREDAVNVKDHNATNDNNNNESGSDGDVWEVVDQSTALEKVKQALRQNRNNNNTKDNKEKTKNTVKPEPDYLVTSSTSSPKKAKARMQRVENHILEESNTNDTTDPNNNIMNYNIQPQSILPVPFELPKRSTTIDTLTLNILQDIDNENDNIQSPSFSQVEPVANFLTASDNTIGDAISFNAANDIMKALDHPNNNNNNNISSINFKSDSSFSISVAEEEKKQKPNPQNNNKRFPMKKPSTLTTRMKTDASEISMMSLMSGLDDSLIHTEFGSASILAGGGASFTGGGMMSMDTLQSEDEEENNN